MSTPKTRRGDRKSARGVVRTVTLDDRTALKVQIGSLLAMVVSAFGLGAYLTVLKSSVEGIRSSLEQQNLKVDQQSIRTERLIEQLGTTATAQKLTDALLQSQAKSQDELSKRVDHLETEFRSLKNH